MTMRRALALGMLAALLPLAAPAESRAAVPQPNIVLVMTDDQRWDSLARMPIVQSELVAKGVTFENAFAVTPLCCPSRASILTGLHSHSTLVYTNARPFGGWSWFEDSSTVATWLKRAGYRTAYLGKYLNGYRGPEVPPGWDRWVGYWNGFFNYTVSRDGVPVRYGSAPGDYSTDVFTREAVSFVETTGEQPLFLVYAPFAPHGPSTPAPRHADAFPGLPPFRPASYDEANVRDKPRWVRRTPRLTADQRAAMDTRARRMTQSLLAVDEGVGEIVDALEASGRLRDTIIVYTSDNGLLWGEHRRTNMKAAAYEESIRLPLVVRYDALGHGRRTESRMATNLDIAPTFAQLGRATRPRVEGRSLVPILSGTEAPWRRQVLLEHLRGGYVDGLVVPTYCGVRSARWKYVAYSTHEEELYDLAVDPAELDNRARDRAHRARLLGLRADVRRLCAPPPPGFTLDWLCTHETTPGRRVAVGTARADTLCGTARNDVLAGRGGRDVLRGRGGSDRLAGGAGGDRLEGGGGRDVLLGGAGNDALHGGPGRDRISGGAGRDAVFARDGVRDAISCGPGRDVVHADRTDVVARECELVRAPRPARPLR